MSKIRLAVLAPHPIQYQAPLFKRLASHPRIDLTVYFCSPEGWMPTYKSDFATTYRWDIPLLDGYSYIFLKNLSPWRNSENFRKLINPQIIHQIFKNRFDALWIHGYSTLTNWLAALTASASQTPILFRGESNRLDETNGLRLYLKRKVLSFLFKKVTGFLSIGTLNSEFYRSYGVPERRIYWCPYAVDNEYFAKQSRELMPQRVRLRKNHGIGPEDKVILYVGKLVSRKRPFDLLHAFENLGSHGTHLIFVGSGPELPNMTRYVQSKGLCEISLVGFKNQTEISQYYVMADIFVLPSEREPWGLAINEAMCFGLPIIATDKVGGGPDLVHHGINGFQYSTGDVRKLRELLRHLIENEDLRNRMSIHSLNLISRWGIRETMDGILSACSAIKNGNVEKLKTREPDVELPSLLRQN